MNKVIKHTHCACTGGAVEQLFPSFIPFFVYIPEYSFTYTFLLQKEDDFILVGILFLFMLFDKLILK